MGDITPDQGSEMTMPESPAGTTSSETASEAAELPKARRSSAVDIISAIINGLGIGLLVGILLGLSLTPVVSGVIATLSSLLVVLIGLNEKYLDPVKSIRIGSFGLFAVAGVLLGLYLRANDPFAPSLEDQFEEYTSIGYKEDEARAFITSTVKSDSTKAKRQATQLYASTVSIDDCSQLKDAKESWPVSEIVNVFDMTGGTWAEFAKVFSSDLPEETQGKALLAMRGSFCGDDSSGEIKMTNLEEIAQLDGNNSVAEIEKVLSSSASGENWQKIVEQVKKYIPEDQRKPVYLATIKVLSHE